MGMKIKRSKGVALVVPTSSMGDIAFLLIIFFMLTSKFMQEANVKHQLPTSPEIDTIKPQQLSLIMDEDGVLWIQGEEAEINSIPEIIAKQQEGMTDEDRKEFTVVFKVHNALIAQNYEPVIRKLAETGVKVAFAGEKEK